MLEMEEKRVDKGHLEKEIKDWQKRIKDLYDQVEGWLGNTKLYSLQQKELSEFREQLPMEYGIGPYKVPGADVLKENKKLMTFQPKGLWVIGANGRIDLLWKKGVFYLVDLSDRFSTPKWTLFRARDEKGSPFDQGLFFKLLDEVETEVTP